MSINKNITFYGSLFGFLFLLDRLSKWWALNLLLEKKQIIVGPYFNLSLVWNRGISWGLFYNDSLLGFSLVTGAISLVIIIFLIYTFIQYKNRLAISFEVFVLAGAISNMVDRFWYGAVVDFFELHVNTWYWPVFNVADICVVVGIIGILIQSMGNSNVNKNKKNLF